MPSMIFRPYQSGSSVSTPSQAVERDALARYIDHELG
jgi:hypothetical protein